VAAQGRRYEHTTTIAAPPEAVWALLQDIDGWGAWNPVYVHARGSAEVGKTIRLRVKFPGMSPTNLRGKVLVVDPPRALHLSSQLLGGLLSATRTFDLGPAAGGATTLIGAETFAGPLAPLLTRFVGPQIDSAIATVNEALKVAAERG
jgi:hypothetical protein